MNSSKHTKVLAGVLVAAIICAAILFYRNGQPPKVVPNAPGYYTGPVRNHKDPNIWGDVNGKQVPAPPDAIPYKPESAARNTANSGD
jgi:hypothetical protein